MNKQPRFRFVEDNYKPNRNIREYLLRDLHPRKRPSMLTDAFDLILAFVTVAAAVVTLGCLAVAIIYFT